MSSMNAGDFLDDIFAPPSKPVPKPVSKQPTQPKVRFTVQIDPSVPEELRNAVVFLMMQGEQASVVGLVETALVSYLEQLRAEHCDGSPFPPRPYGPPPGRRLLREPPAS